MPMSRTKVFVSYSHADRYWMERLKTHLTVLERQQLLHVWADVRIEAGAEWRKQIDAALTEARVAVLLVTPAYLASEFIWANEIDPIMKHREAGMRVLPLVARPCAWRLELRLSALQARPSDGRPLSTGTEAQIDLDLAGFTYELAALVGTLNADAAVEWERMVTTGDRSTADTTIHEDTGSPPEQTEYGQSW
jgi:hypothetical protein